MPRIVHVVGARPNFMKIAPLLRALERRGRYQNVLIHTGQHYDDDMSGSFFRDLAIREPDLNLGVGSGTHAQQTAGVLVGMEEVLQAEGADLLVVVGDVNSTVASALAASKLHVPVAHVEAGLRSGDRRMPEEINRLLTDQLSMLCLTPSLDANDNLKREGIAEERIHFVGNIMIDSLHFSAGRIEAAEVLETHAVTEGGYALVTLHRPSNVDDAGTLEGILDALEAIAGERTVLFPAHPRTRGRMDEFGVEPRRVRVVDPIPYLEMVALMKHAAVVLTDSGGIQEETTALGVPCLTLRDTTERPITVSEGTNTLVPDRSTGSILRAWETARVEERRGRIPKGWDGHTAERIADVFDRWFANGGTP
ncbi:MAG: UDP-N-acetylglucosamine 2-epimerase (non-hydrolyzing) [Gemmatimonadota bacterium]|jgi:UDP-N-acetylglucosamine 2-epimerase (non-hydrolysing)